MTTNTDPSAVGVYDDLYKAERTIDELRRAGFQAEEIGIIGHVGQNGEVPTPPAANYPEENAITGFLCGASIGAIVGGFVMIVIPGLAQVAGLGTWFGVLGGVIFGAVACGLLIAFSSFIFMRPKARLYASELDKGRFLVTVKNPNRQEEAINVLRRQGLFAERD